MKKLLVRKHLANKLRSVHMPNTYIIGVDICECLRGNFWQIVHVLLNSPIYPTKIFVCVVSGYFRFVSLRVHCRAKVSSIMWLKY